MCEESSLEQSLDLKQVAGPVRTRRVPPYQVEEASWLQRCLQKILWAVGNGVNSAVHQKEADWDVTG